MRQKIFSDMIEAMRNKDKDLLSVIRLLKGAIQLEELNKKKELNDEEVISIVVKQIKQRKESIEQFEKGNRQDLIEKTSQEIEVLNKYLPKQLSTKEIEVIISDVFNEVNPTSVKDLGKVMGLVSPKVKGKADMRLVNKIIKEKLEKI
ncbi:MAG: GatB/YqeY domain-containing protein [Bacilli bacterium]|nr:GatB/YqeY domain-containing protein [Bacilli bacterium]MDD4282474.1 GatB/YqeY domain-containing protein [Bacilli bacterium]MDD4719046.1 GatB/YqeY domain-containing protein [Bacilli bacterium]